MHNAEAVIREQIMPGAKESFSTGLTADPVQHGRVVVSLTLAPDGSVDATTPVARQGTLSDETIACILVVASRAKFDAPGRAGSKITIPFNFKLQAPEDAGVVATPLADALP
jgi:hypothetical protein